MIRLIALFLFLPTMLACQSNPPGKDVAMASPPIDVISGRTIKLGKQDAKPGAKGRNLSIAVQDSGWFEMTGWQGQDQVALRVDVDKKSRMYKRADGNFEWDITLKKKPVSNVFTYKLVSNGLSFYSQPALTSEQVADGHIRPDSVVGSYAVYRSDGKKDNEFGTSKFTHIYRPKIIDADGKWAWCDIVIDTIRGQASAIAPQSFLDNNKYPVVIDPTWGYTTQGGSGLSLSAYLRTYKIAGAAGTIDPVYWYLFSATWSRNCRIGLYDESGGLANTLLAQSASTAAGTTPSWLQWPFTYTMSSGVNYWAAIFAAATDPTIAYDVVGGSDFDKQRYDDAPGWTYPTFPDPMVPRSDTSSYSLSIYFHYTAAGGAEPSPRRRMMDKGPR